MRSRQLCIFACNSVDHVRTTVFDIERDGNHGQVCRIIRSHQKCADYGAINATGTMGKMIDVEPFSLTESCRLPRLKFGERSRKKASFGLIDRLEC